jgi:phosphoglycerate kinase
MRTLDKFDFEGKVVLLRADLNSDVRDGKVVLSERIGASARTISELKRKGARVVILAHQGRKGKKDFVSLRSHARFLNRFVKVGFVNDVCGSRAIEAIKKLKNGSALLLENVRFVGGEFAPERGKRNKLYKLVEVADVFVNDAFSVCHRRQASVVLFPRYLKSFAGRLLESEVSALKKVEMSSKDDSGEPNNCLYVLGGAKPEDNIKLLGKNKILACGLFGQTCLVASGKKLGAQDKYLNKVVKDFSSVVLKLKCRLRGVEVPSDFAVKVGGRRVERVLDEFPSRYEIFDIGAGTIERYVKEIGKAGCVYVKWPAGDAGDVKFSKGTVALLRAAAKADFSLVGGGHLSDTIKKYKLSGFDHVSLSGGATVAYLAGEKLPGLVALGENLKR